MSDDYRVRAHLASGSVHDLLKALQADGSASARGVVSHDDHDVFVYADTSVAAAQERTALERAVQASGVQAELVVTRWHDEEERWEDASAPMPEGAAADAAEHANLIADEDERSREINAPEWEVLITLPSHRDARAFARRLQAEGIPVLSRWRHLAVGADDEDQAKALAERLRTEAPAGSELVAEPSAAEALRVYSNGRLPYAVFGPGLGY